MVGGKKEEAAQALNDYIASNPGEEWVKEAQGVLEQLDSLAAQGARMQEARNARSNSSHRPGMAKPPSRRGVKPQFPSRPRRP